MAEVRMSMAHMGAACGSQRYYLCLGNRGSQLVRTTQIRAHTLLGSTWAVTQLARAGGVSPSLLRPATSPDTDAHCCLAQKRKGLGPFLYHGQPARAPGLPEHNPACARPARGELTARHGDDRCGQRRCCLYRKGSADTVSLTRVPMVSAQ